MNKRSYSNRTVVFLVVAIIIMVFMDRVTDPRWKSAGQEDASPSAEATVAIETPATEEKALTLDDQIAPEIMGPHKPEFSPPLEFSMMGPLVPYKEYEKAESALEPAWIKNAVPVADVPDGRPRVAIIIDDMGMDRRHTRAVRELPGPLTLAYLPYAGDLKTQTAEARARGHELMVHVPMAPMNGSLDGGPEVLKPDESPEEFARILNDGLSAFDGYVGINNHMGSRMTQDRPGMRRVMAELKKRGLLFVDSRTINSSVAADEAEKAGIPFAVRDVFLDHEETSEAVADALAEVERQALKNGSAIAIGHPKEETVAALRAWLPTLAEKGITLVPVSRLVTVPAGAAESPVLQGAATP